MRTLIIADVHANLPAFRAVLDDAGHFDQVLFLGDLANFGPCPSECVDLLRELDSINIMGNHDYFICCGWAKRNFFDAWSRAQLSDEQIGFLRSFEDEAVLGDILAIHGAWDVEYKILPGIPPEKVEEAFSRQLRPEIRHVYFGHYHYQIDLEYQGVAYHSIRAVGHHRDKDVRAGYSILEDGHLTHHRVAYDIEETLHYADRITCWKEPFKSQWFELLQNAYQEDILKGETEAMQAYEAGKEI